MLYPKIPIAEKVPTRSTRAADLPPPAVLPHFLADQAGHPRLFFCDRDDPVLRHPVRDLKDELGPDRLLELFAVLDRHNERAQASDDAVLVIEIEVVDVHRRI